MHRIAKAIVALVLVCGAGVSIALLPTVAFAAPLPPVAASVVKSVSVPPLGDFPVTCKDTSPPRSIADARNMTPILLGESCTADDAGQRVSPAVCKNIAVASDTTLATLSVCSDYQPLIDAATKQAAVPPPTPTNLNFGCAPLDVTCISEETISNQAAKWIADDLKGLSANTAFNTSGPLWAVAVDQAGFWWTIVGFVVVGATAIGIALAAIMGDRKLILRAFGGILGTFAALFLSIWAVGKGLDVVDGLTAPLLAHATAGGSLQDTVMALLYPPGLSAILGNESPIAILLYLCLFCVGLVVMAFVDSVRNFGLMVLIAFAPLAFSILGTKVGSTWLRNWTAAVVALILTKPLTTGLLVMVLNGMGSVKSLYSVQALPLAFGLVLSLLMPFVAFGLFSFIGGAAAGSFEGVGAHLRGGGRDAGRLANTTSRRIGASVPKAFGGNSRGAPSGQGTSAGASGSRKAVPGAPAVSNPVVGNHAGASAAIPVAPSKPAAIRDGRFKGAGS
ncbi:MAG TPA: hypothetical protein VIO57_12230 [Chloroflexota bacterium]|jgi:hypothetical protein